MELKAIFAQLSCADLDTSLAWFKNLFGRAPDARPMEGLAEWHLEDHAGFQLYANPRDAGHGTLTLMVADLRVERARLAEAGTQVTEIEEATTVTLMRLRDPDGNLVVLATPRAT